ncbi:MAG TPA: hypothetical protein VFR18_11405 [Terriglobia bacterium]|nr:hypothetical protein [Terriglobia bacterium]
MKKFVFLALLVAFGTVRSCQYGLPGLQHHFGQLAVSADAGQPAEHPMSGFPDYALRGANRWPGTWR